MGDLVLLQHEVNPALSAALTNGLEVTALHNHFFYDNARVYFISLLERRRCTAPPLDQRSA
jgi:Domain of Unknown Function (DUF1259)